ncbi:replication protein H [Halonotius aquaticus]|uniref:Replication protein H n=1 Tax=Halonotius aquaticus TaxID=2216978 RepID=A0A3A6PX67_9EURY|nr:DUF5817 domain-containing protein [Halonotius aquaticus]RJX42852.1 replication protein H [Halonotius aquaticus]
MYAVVGCNNCSMLWLLTDPDSADSATCPRCERTHQTSKLKRLFESEDRSAAREARSALLAKKQGDSEAFADVAHVSELEQQAEDAGIDDREYLEASGIDADSVAAVGETTRETAGSHDEIVREAVREAGGEDRPTEREIVDYAADRGVPAEKASNLLEKLCRVGDASESRGRYRLL